MKKSTVTILAIAIIALALCATFICGCEGTPQQQVSDTGVQKMTASVDTDTKGHTNEQNNIARRVEDENRPGVVRYVYCISSYTGKVIGFYVTNGKITSSGKRLTPFTVVGGYNGGWYGGMDVVINHQGYKTQEVIQDDGTYGDSIPYLYFWDSANNYHQIYPNAGMFIHVASVPQPIRDGALVVSFANST